MPSPGSGFQLEKWYFDCVSDDGDVFIGYAGRVRLGIVPLSYQATIASSPAELTTQHFSLLPAALPKRSGDRIAWSNRLLSVAGEWSPVGPTTDFVLLDEDGLRVTWRCHVPGGPARILHRGVERRGMGYAEVLAITGPPGRLPIRELHWGRFVSGDHHLVWIEWRGPRPLRFILWDGRRLSEGTVDTGGVTSDAGRLSLSDTRPVRIESVADSVFGRRRWLQRLLPAGVGAWKEEKWVSRGRLETTSGDVLGGWAIHERVRMT